MSNTPDASDDDRDVNVSISPDQKANVMQSSLDVVTDKMTALMEQIAEQGKIMAQFGQRIDELSRENNVLRATASLNPKTNISVQKITFEIKLTSLTVQSKWEWHVKGKISIFGYDEQYFADVPNMIKKRVHKDIKPHDFDWQRLFDSEAPYKVDRTTRIILFDAVLTSLTTKIHDFAAIQLTHGDMVGLWHIATTWFMEHDFQSHLILLEHLFNFAMNKNEKIREFRARKKREALEINQLQRQGIAITPELLLCILLAGASKRHGQNLENKLQEYEKLARSDSPLVGDAACETWFDEVQVVALRHEKQSQPEKANAVTHGGDSENKNKGDCYAWLNKGKCTRNNCSFKHPKDKKGTGKKTSNDVGKSNSHKTSKSTSSSKTTVVKCDYCRRNGHGESKCFKKKNDESLKKISELNAKMSELVPATRKAVKKLQALQEGTTSQEEEGRVSSMEQEYTDVMADVQRLTMVQEVWLCSKCDVDPCVCVYDHSFFGHTNSNSNTLDLQTSSDSSAQLSNPATSAQLSKISPDFPQAEVTKDGAAVKSGVATNGVRRNVSWLAAAYGKQAAKRA
jgi:hypothetical protein